MGRAPRSSRGVWSVCRSRPPRSFVLIRAPVWPPREREKRPWSPSATSRQFLPLRRGPLRRTGGRSSTSAAARRRRRSDCPWPKPSMAFGHLTDRWQIQGLPWSASAASCGGIRASRFAVALRAEPRGTARRGPRGRLFFVATSAAASSASGLLGPWCGTCGHDFLVARRWATTKSVQGSRRLPLMQRPPHGPDR